MQQQNPLRSISPPLLEWYGQNARVLPWRDNPTPYRVWVSEIMLQQTRVEAVKPYFERFVAALPDVNALAAAPEEQLLKLWEGLGYYIRVKNMQKAAREVVERFGGELPKSREELLTLPGIGDYTSGSIASIAFGLPVPAVDGNVLRVISRLTASYEDIAKPAVKKAVEHLVEDVIPAGRAGDFNQALMELGATVCLPGASPLCERCPVRETCGAFTLGIQGELPVKQKKAPRRVEEKTVFLLVCDGKAALQKRPDKGLLAGMWEFPHAPGFLSPEQAEQTLEEWGIVPAKVSGLKPAKHIFSHVEWHMRGYLATLQPGETPARFCWHTVQELKDQYALPTAYEAFVKLFYSLSEE